MALDPGRTVAELRELRELTGDEEGAQRVAWTDTWVQAKKWLASKLEPLGVEEEIDQAGNQWFTVRGNSERALLIGGHIDSVPNGGWLDGALNVGAGAEVLRRIAEEGEPPVTVHLVNWADEEGARFGRSLFGSSAAAGSMVDQDELRSRQDAGGQALPDVLAVHGTVRARGGERPDGARRLGAELRRQLGRLEVVLDDLTAVEAERDTLIGAAGDEGCRHGPALLAHRAALPALERIERVGPLHGGRR